MVLGEVLVINEKFRVRWSSMLSKLKNVIPSEPRKLRILFGPFSGGVFIGSPRASLRKVLGLYEHELNEWLTHALPKVEQLLDVGSNDGYFALGTAEAFRRNGVRGRIICFEPDVGFVPGLEAAAQRYKGDLAAVAASASLGGRRRQASPAAEGPSMTRAFLFECAKLYRRRLLLAGLLTLAESLALLALPWIAGHAAQHFLSGSDRDVRPVIFGLVGVLALQAVLRFANRYVAAGVAADLLASLRNRIFQHLQSLPLSFHQQRRQGETLALLTHDVAHLSSFLSGKPVPIVHNRIGIGTVSCSCAGKLLSWVVLRP